METDNKSTPEEEGDQCMSEEDSFQTLKRSIEHAKAKAAELSKLREQHEAAIALSEAVDNVVNEVDGDKRVGKVELLMEANEQFKEELTK